MQIEVKKRLEYYYICFEWLGLGERKEGKNILVYSYNKVCNKVK